MKLSLSGRDLESMSREELLAQWQTLATFQRETEARWGRHRGVSNDVLSVLIRSIVRDISCLAIDMQVNHYVVMTAIQMALNEGSGK